MPVNGQRRSPIRACEAHSQWRGALPAVCMWLAVLVQPLVAQESIIWNSEANAVNLTSGGAPMDGSFRFEIGVFADGFTPTPANMAEWSQNWHAAQRVAYDPISKRFSGSITPDHNDSPFTSGKAAYVWGFSGNSSSGEWILFRSSAWVWPEVLSIPGPPLFSDWFAKDATPVVGQINASGSPFLMKSAAVAGVVPPRTTWAQWQADQLTGEPLNGPTADPDRDGQSNLLEYVFGTPPRQAGAAPAMSVTLAESGGQKFLQISIPRRIEHPATLAVEVSSDLALWQSGSSHTEVLADTPAALVVRDKTPLGAPAAKRFMRLRASLPPP